MAGVDYKLATKSLKVPHDQIWYPSRSELISYGVLRIKDKQRFHKPPA